MCFIALNTLIIYTIYFLWNIIIIIIILQCSSCANSLIVRSIPLATNCVRRGYLVTLLHCAYPVITAIHTYCKVRTGVISIPYLCYLYLLIGINSGFLWIFVISHQIKFNSKHRAHKPKQYHRRIVTWKSCYFRTFNFGRNIERKTNPRITRKKAKNK